jgi:ketosteroid isomerase-like protein
LLFAALGARAADPAPVVAAERAFAADAAKDGIRASFLKWSAPDAVVFAPAPANARAVYAALPERPGRSLQWRPVWAGLAASGDLGFTTGPYSLNGQPGGSYFTVWKRQPDGAWRWIYDDGIEDDVSAAPPPAAAVAVLPPGRGGARPDEAMIGASRAEDALALGAATDAAAAYRAVLAPDARVQGSARAPAATPAAIAAELAGRPGKIAFTRLGGGASGAGDLAWTYGEAVWDGGRGHYVRIWRRRDGWRLVFDQLSPAPKPNS